MDGQTKKELKTQEDAIFLNNTYYTIIIKIYEVEETSPFLNKIGGGLKCSVADLFGGNFELERTKPENKCTMRRRRILEPYNRQTVPYKNKKKYRQFLQVFFYKKDAGAKPVKCFMLEDEIDTAREIYLIDEGSKTPGQRAVIHLAQKDSKVVTDEVAAYLAKLMRNNENEPDKPDSVVSCEDVTILEPDEPKKEPKRAHTDVNAEHIKGKIRYGVAQIIGGGDDDDSKRANAQNIDADVAEGGVAIIRNNIALKDEAKAREQKMTKEKIEGIIKKIAEKTEEIEKLDGNIEKEQQKKRTLLEKIQSPATTVRINIIEDELAECKENLTLFKKRREKAETLKDKFEEELYLYQKHTEN